MKSMQGLLHETSLQAAQERQTTFATTSTVGQKRNFSSSNAASNSASGAAPYNVPSTTNGTGVQFQRASSLPAVPAQLSASRIINLEETQGISEYSQRRIIAATPTSSYDPELTLAHPTYGLSPHLVRNFSSLGIKQIYPWQKSCLKGPGLLTGEANLVYCAPTGGGKSLVADCESSW